MKELKRSVSMDEALMYLLKCRTDKPSEFAGSWKMDENEVEKIKRELKENLEKMGIVIEGLSLCDGYN